jgi:hypothetical protein
MHWAAINNRLQFVEYVASAKGRLVSSVRSPFISSALLLPASCPCLSQVLSSCLAPLSPHLVSLLIRLRFTQILCIVHSASPAPLVVLYFVLGLI